MEMFKLTPENIKIIDETINKWIKIYDNNDFDFETTDEELINIIKNTFKSIVSVEFEIIKSSLNIFSTQNMWYQLQELMFSIQYNSLKSYIQNYLNKIDYKGCLLFFYSIFIDILNKTDSIKIYSNYFKYFKQTYIDERLFKTGFFCFSFDLNEIVIYRFNKLEKYDNNNRLHDLNGPAIIDYKNDKFYYFHGLQLSENMFLKLQSGQFTFEEFIELRNEEIKSAVLGYYTEKFGNEFVYRFLSEHLKEVDTYVDKKSSEYLKGTVKSMNIGVYTLFKGKFRNINWKRQSINIAFIRCYCPSTDRIFFLSVSPYYKTAKDAIASLCRIPSKLKNDIVSIARQGEMFSFNFTENGLNILKSMKKSDFNKTVAISGDEYFSKMKFEY